jgi:predicted transcriptional regulator
MAMTLRLTEEETEALRRQAEREHRSMHEVARMAVLDRIGRMDRAERIRQTVDYVMVRDAEALRMLSE